MRDRQQEEGARAISGTRTGGQQPATALVIEDNLRVINLRLADDGREPIAQFGKEKLAARLVKHRAGRVDCYQQMLRTNRHAAVGWRPARVFKPREISRQT